MQKTSPKNGRWRITLLGAVQIYVGATKTKLIGFPADQKMLKYLAKGPSSWKIRKSHRAMRWPCG